MTLMADEPISLSDRIAGHDFRVERQKISIFPDAISPEIIEGIRDEQKVVFVSIGAGETRVNVIDDEGRSITSWVAVFGWSSLCSLRIDHEGDELRVKSVEMMTRALRGSLRRYGKEVDTSSFKAAARKHFQGALGYIVDQTVGDASEYDRIILASPEWLHDVLQDCLSIRPHIAPEIQEL
jgi:hypothetical protein